MKPGLFILQAALRGLVLSFSLVSAFRGSIVLAQSSQVVEALCRSEDELKYQLSSIQSKRKELDEALTQQDSARKGAVYSHLDKKYAQQEILKQISQLQKALAELDASADSVAANIDTREQATGKLKQEANELAAQEDQYNRALLDVQFAIRRAQDQARGMKNNE